MTTEMMKEKFCKNNLNHILHPFRYFCELCKIESLCKECIWYRHKYCVSCDDLIANASIGWIHA